MLHVLEKCDIPSYAKKNNVKASNIPQNMNIKSNGTMGMANTNETISRDFN